MTGPRHYSAAFVDSFPTPMEPGILYISAKYSTAGHSCACGCGNEVVTKLSPARWRITYDGQISLAPSVGAIALPCNSHYFITRGEVDWDRKLTPSETERALEADQHAVEDYRSSARPGWFKRLWQRIFR
ncbi:DUF6527 family protein [Arthrobacter sp. CC3]|uniref:DUF6527 family protein n=1 Tax=Arthrobacter sp. CC3 TaxID=3029185 RepID=UPI0032668EA9